MAPLTTEEAIQQRLAEERDRLARELGLEEKQVTHFEKPVEREFTKDQRPYTTVLYGGLTWKHERLIHGALSALGYRCEALATPDVAAFQLGKEYGNNGQCNPTYFTVGNLVQHLQKLEEGGMARQEILDNHIFVTAGACGPCRFGMYEAEYRLALRNSGFDGFRVMLFQQSGGLSQSGAQAGLEMNTDFFLAILNAMNMGDLLNDVGYQLRPYEVEPGATDAALEECMEMLHDLFEQRQPYRLEGKVGSFLKGLPKVGGMSEQAAKFVDQLRGEEYVGAFRKVRDRLAEVKLDRTRVKPLVKITGEFWAQTTEGDGNFNMFQFLERESAQVVVEPVGTWIMYMIHQAKQRNLDRKGVTEDEAMPSAWRVDKRMAADLAARKKNAKLTLAESVFKREWNRLREALNDIPHELTDQYELQRLGHPYVQLARRRRRGPPRGGQEHLLHQQGPLPHGPVAEAVRVHALDPVRRRAVGGDQPVQGHDLPADRDLGRGRDQRPQPRADGPRRGPGQGEDGDGAGAGGDRADAGRGARRTPPSTPSSRARCTTCPTPRASSAPAANFVQARRRAHGRRRHGRASRREPSLAGSR